jgi:AcrR family transcriptional regulator
MSTARTQHNTRQQQRQQTRTQILDAAIEVFARSGFEATSLAGIAARAGVKKALVQYHFSTKEQLWQSAASRLWTERNARLAEVMSNYSDTDALANMRRGFTALLEFTRENPQWLWFMFHEAAANGDRLQWLIDEFLREDYRLGEEFVRQFQGEGQMREGSPLYLLHLISGALTYNLMVAPLTHRVTDVDLASPESIARQVTLLQTLLAPQED